MRDIAGPEPAAGSLGRTGAPEPARDLVVDGVAVRHRDAAGTVVTTLSVDHLSIPAGSSLALVGPSGAGKTTLLEVITGLRRPDQGRVAWGDRVVSDLGEAARDHWRRRTVGLVFQDFELLPELSALDNVLLPASFSGLSRPPGLAARARDLLGATGVPDPGRRAAVLSRGEQQRVAVARALLADPPLILCDEPTASLDPETGTAVAELILAAARRRSATLVVVTHDRALAGRLDRIIPMAAGRLVEEPQ